MHFIKYALIGVLNTAIHWGFFYGLFYLNSNQGLSNAIAFLIAVTFSYFINAKLNFKAQLNLIKYGAFVAFMALLAYLTGFCADLWQFPPLIMLILFSAISLVLGFLFSKWYVFK